jgi:hypothetical protein
MNKDCSQRIAEYLLDEAEASFNKDVLEGMDLSSIPGLSSQTLEGIIKIAQHAHTAGYIAGYINALKK